MRQSGHWSVGNAAGLVLCRRVAEGRELLLVCMMSLCCAGSLVVVWLFLSMLWGPPSFRIMASVKLISVDGKVSGG